MKKFEKFLENIKNATLEELDFMLRNRVKSWYELFMLSFDTSIPKESGIEYLYNNFGDMIDYESCKEIYDFVYKLKNTSQIEILFDEIVKSFVNTLEYKKRILGIK